MANSKELMDKAVESTIRTLNILGIQVDRGVQRTETPEDMVHIQIQFVGDTSGYFILEITKEFGCKIANQMLQGMMEVNSVDEMCKSVLGEVCNMISGNISTVFSEMGYNSDIKPPIVEVRNNPLNSKLGVTLAEDNKDNLINTYFLIPRT